MEKAIVNAQKDGCEKKDSMCSLNKGIKGAEVNNLKFTDLKSKGSVGVKPEQKLLDAGHSSQTDKRSTDKSLVQSYGTDCSIPKHIVSLNMRYLRRRLELLQVGASNSLSITTPCNIPIKLLSPKMEILFDGFKPPKSRRICTFEFDRPIVECPLTNGPGNLAKSPVGKCLIGTVTGNTKMRNIMKNPLFCHLGGLDGVVNLGKARSIDVKEPICSDYMSSSSSLSICSSPKLEKETVLLRNMRYGSKALGRRHLSISSTNPLFSDQFSSSSDTMVCQGMIQCTWKSGIPYFTFSVDDQREVYVANPWNVESSDDRALNYLYLFHSRAGGQKEHGSYNSLSDVVGKMKVSTSFSFCSNNSKLVETKFVLFGANENQLGGTQSSIPTPTRNKGLPKKMVEVFKKKHSFKHRTAPKFGGSNALREDICQNIVNKFDKLGKANLLGIDLPPNFELAAIVVKDHLHDNYQEETVGGWGLKFLKKVELSDTSVEASISSENCQETCLHNRTDCATSMSVLVPAGLHGGPRTRSGGPLSLIERWKTGGLCDCGGWDIGCPLTVLNNQSYLEVLHQMSAQGECKSFDLFIQGAKQGVPVLKMVNIHDNLYIIHFQSTLSALQSFSIAVAILHTKYPALQPKNLQKLKLQD